MKAKIKLVLITVVVTIIIAVGGGSFFIYHSEAKQKTKELSADEILATMVETEPISTNLQSGGYIQLRFKLQTNSVKAKEELEKRNFQVRNTALLLLSSMTEEQAASPDGMTKFEEDMKIQLNKQMQDGKINQIYIINKMIQ
ncbi:flagellar basal body-associated FliL family protein [Neobacillus citreus]|uniref:Flagellar protein FliL n=1 Tax=Neobacillus citreus TaxID=2833578 RepID=A0A942SUD1_9BACI|nr:flagellar basal body-associated FliL family protein [Neobacillus citreus]MCH6263929.1 flagellar basal body-associated FliL family protein [Neobacillus citreus]